MLSAAKICYQQAASAGTLLVGSMGLSAQFAKSAGLGAMLQVSTFHLYEIEVNIL